MSFRAGIGLASRKRFRSPRGPGTAWLIRPDASLALDFVNNRAWDGVEADYGFPSITVSRNLAAYGQTAEGRLTLFPANTLRRTNLGLLAEEARTNALWPSQDFSGARWAKNAVSLGAATQAPDGTLTATEVAEDGTNTSHGILQSIGKAASAVQYAASSYVKPRGRSFCMLAIDDGTGTNRAAAHFDLSGAGTVKSSAAAGTYTIQTAGIQALADGIKRIWLVGTTGTETTVRTLLYSADNGTYTTALPTLAGLNDVAFEAWGADLEGGPFPTSYIPTVTAGVTRPAELATMALALGSPSNIWAYGKGLASQGIGATSQTLFSVDSGTNNERVSLARSTARTSSLTIVAGGVTQFGATPGGSVWLDGITLKQALRGKLNDFKGSAVGALSAADTSGTMPTGLTTLRLGHLNTGIQIYNGYIQEMAIGLTAITDSDLQAMTA